MAQRFKTTVTIGFPSGERSYSVRGILHPSKYYKNLMVEAGALTYGMSVFPGRVQMSDISLRFWNRSFEFSQLKASDSFHNAEVTVERYDSDGNREVVAMGFLNDWYLADKIFGIGAIDPQRERLDEPVDHGVLLNLTTATFPDLPSTQAPLLVPLPYGKLELTSAAIAASAGPATVPCYLIDPAVGQSKYRYVCAQAAIDSVKRVFNYETLVAAASYTVTTAVYNGVTMTVIDFDADQRNATRARDLEVTCDLWGIKSGSTLIENPAEQAKHFIENYAPSGLTVDMATAIVSCNSRVYLGAWVLLDNRWTYQDVLDRIAESFFMPIYPMRNGKITAAVVTEAQPTATTEFSETLDIKRNSFRIMGNREHASRIRYEYMYHWARNIWQKEQSIFILGEEAKLGREIIKDLMLWAVRDSTTARLVARSYGPALREAAQYVEMEVRPESLSDVELNAGIGITHREGIAVSGGYNNRAARVLQSDYYPSPKEARIFVRSIVTPNISFDEELYVKSDFWLLARPEQVVEIAELVTGGGSVVKDAVAWSLHIGGDEYAGGIQRT